MKSVFEADQDGDSVVLWEAGVGHRIIYPYPIFAERAALWLHATAARFHIAKAKTGQLSIFVYGEDHSPYTFVRKYMKIATDAGYKINENELQRPQEDFW